MLSLTRTSKQIEVSHYLEHKLRGIWQGRVRCQKDKIC